MTTAPDWTLAACIGHNPEVFFPAKTVRNRHAWDEPRAICQPCPIRDACLAWALETGQVDGMWGGLDERQRAALMPKRPPVLAGCGTYAAATRHQKRGEPLDDACIEARRAKNLEYAQAARNRKASA